MAMANEAEGASQCVGQFGWRRAKFDAKRPEHISADVDMTMWNAQF
jgi:hypothetical protein